MARTMATTAADSDGATHGGISRRVGDVAGIDAAARRIATLEAVAERCRDAYVMFQYDIPDVAGVANPSEMLWFHGFRMTLSCWVMPKGQLAHPDMVGLMAELTEAGCKTHVIEYAESQRAAIEAIAREQLAEEVRRVHTSLIESIGRADDALKAALDVMGPVLPATADKAERARDNRVRAVIRKASEQLDASITCAQVFDETEAVGPLLEALRLAISSRAAAFNVEMAAKAGKPVKVELPALPPASVTATPPASAVALDPFGLPDTAGDMNEQDDDFDSMTEERQDAVHAYAYGEYDLVDGWQE